MTWVIGCPTFLGYGFLVSDVRVSFGEKPSPVSIQKIYPVSNNLIAGFAGSVEFGFLVIAALQRSIAFHGPGTTVRPAKFFFQVYRNIRRTFESCSPAIRQLGSQIILVGVSTEVSNGIPGEGVVSSAIFRSRDGFFPQVFRATAPPYPIESIGSGRAVKPYADALKVQVGNSSIQNVVIPGAYSYMFAHPLRLAIQRNPDPTVSDYLQILEVSRRGIQLNDTAGTEYPPKGDPIKHEAPPLARSWREFCALTATASLDLSQACC